LVIRVRCPAVNILELKETIRNFSTESLLQALRFIYTGIPTPGTDELTQLAALFQRYDMIPKMQSVSDSEIVRSSISPKENLRSILPRRSKKSNVVERNHVEKDLADTVPVENQPEETEDAVVDLTQSRGSPVAWNLEPDEDHRERVEEMAKIQSFIEQRSSDVAESEDDDEQDRLEMEKLFYLRQSIEPEKDIFEDEAVPKPHEGVVVLSSDSEHNNFEDSTDEDVRSPEPPVVNDEVFDPPYYETPDYGVDYDNVYVNSPLESQSLVGVSPRTPRRVLEGSSPKRTPVQDSIIPESGCDFPTPIRTIPSEVL